MELNFPDGNWQPLADYFEPRPSTRLQYSPHIHVDSQSAYSPVGTEVAQQFLVNSNNQSPGGDCFSIVYQRLAQAFDRVADIKLPHLAAFQQFDRLFGSKWNPSTSWLRFPLQYRGKGAPGALASIGLARIVDIAGIWSAAGDLEEGAVVQTWKKTNDFNGIRDGTGPELDPDTNLPRYEGHSFIFLEYVDDADGRGMRVADQGYKNNTILRRTDYEQWFGGNLQTP